MPNFEQFGLPINVALFVVAAVVVWRAGLRISQYADVISEKTGLGHAVLGLLLLGGVTSLPELAVTITASAGDNTALAVNNILGGIAMQVTILAMADLAIKHRALTSVVPDSVVMLQAALNILVLSLVAAAVIAGDVPLLGIGVWVWAILGACLVSMRMIAVAADRHPWRANADAASLLSPPGEEDATGGRLSLRQALWRATGAGAVILAAGYIVTRTAEVIAEITGLGQSFAGAVLVAISTSLPEVSTVLAAVRLGFFTMAISDILGTNLFDVGLLFVVDAVGSGPPALSTAGPFAAFAAVLGSLLTAIFLAGLAERSDRTILRVGYDSGAVVIAYLGGLAILFTLR